VENKFPLLVHRYELREDSGGAGRWRGGLGTEVEVEALAPINYMTRSDRVVNPPWGLAGGEHAKGNRIAIRRKNKESAVFPNGKVDTRLAKGDAYIMSSGGGGGFGPPHERPIEALKRDVRQGYVSLESAWKDYGVRFDPQTLEPLEISRNKER
jgi:N-methylhydantoinase B